MTQLLDLALVTAADAENPVLGDLRLVDGQLVLVEDAAAIVQDLVVTLRWFRGEWFLDRRTGVPWFQSVLGQKASAAAVERVLRRSILQRPGIAAIVRLGISIDTSSRLATVSPLEVRTITGDVVSVPPIPLGEEVA